MKEEIEKTTERVTIKDSTLKKLEMIIVNEIDLQKMKKSEKLGAIIDIAVAKYAREYLEKLLDSWKKSTKKDILENIL